MQDDHMSRERGLVDLQVTHIQTAETTEGEEEEEEAAVITHPSVGLAVFVHQSSGTALFCHLYGRICIPFSVGTRDGGDTRGPGLV